MNVNVPDIPSLKFSGLSRRCFRSSSDNPCMPPIDLELRGEFIELDKLLKATGLADSGGQARAFIMAGEVKVNGQVELRKTAKMRAGQVVEFSGQQVRVIQGADAG